MNDDQQARTSQHATADQAQASAPDDDFRAAYGEPLRDVLDVTRWRTGDDLGELYEQLTREVTSAVEQETRLHDPIRRKVFARVQSQQLVRGAGVYRATPDELKLVHEGLLMTGAVEACDATRHTHETLPLTVTQIGVSLVRYQGDLGTWVQRLFRRSLRESLPDPVDEALALLERRDRRHSVPAGADQEEPSRLLQRAIMTYAERAILTRRSTARWRMGHGNPAAYELLSGAAGSIDLVIESTKVLEELILGHRKFVFVPSEPSDQLILTIGDALRPLEYAIVYPLSFQVERFLEGADYDLSTTSSTVTRDGRQLTPRAWMTRFRDDVAAQVVVGVYRASEVAPARVFYAHLDHAHEAARIALADSLLQPHRGFPMLIDVADHVCTATMGPDTLAGPIQAAYTRAGVPLRYLGERRTRGR
ncbi:MAG: hypothetical protein U0893_10405 [Chloroflexota bacterium]